MKIIIFGSNGQLGRELEKKLSKKKYIKLTSFSKKKIDITDAQLVKSIFKKHLPQIVFIAAAYTDVDGSEKNKKECKSVNYYSVKNISKLCKIYKTLLMYYSTDYVFSGNSKTFYSENDKKNPLNY